IEKLIQRNIFKLKDGGDLFEGSCEELERLLKGDKQVNIKKVRVMSEEQRKKTAERLAKVRGK
ncbi:Fur-regulated basic protein FbpA, partial [Bacillus toyonensis]